MKNQTLQVAAENGLLPHWAHESVDQSPNDAPHCQTHSQNYQHLADGLRRFDLLMRLIPGDLNTLRKLDYLYSWYLPTSTPSRTASASSVNTAKEQYKETKYDAIALLLMPMKRIDKPGLCSPGKFG